MKLIEESGILFGYDESMCKCIKFDEADEKKRKAKMSTWGSKLKQKLHWIQSVRSSVNNVENPPPINLTAKYST